MSKQNETRRVRHYRKMAQEMREMADGFIEDEARISMLSMAEAYEQLAESLEARERSLKLALRDVSHQSKKPPHVGARAFAK